MSQAPPPQLAKNRAVGKPGTRWAFFSRFRVHARDKTLYLDRLRILQTPWFGVYLHRIYQPDDDRALHDHPWPFVSFVLLGRYTEEVPAVPGMPCTPQGRTTRYVNWFNVKRATDTHRISRTTRLPVVSLLLVGRRCREWGFVTDRGWVQWDQYVV